MDMRLEEKDGVYRFKPLSTPGLPLVEGKCPPQQDENGNWYYPEPVEYIDPEIREYDDYSVLDKDEYWGYETVCKHCGVRFIAYEKDEPEQVRRFCPGCGTRLEKDGETE